MMPEDDRAIPTRPTPPSVAKGQPSAAKIGVPGLLLQLDSAEPAGLRSLRAGARLRLLPPHTRPANTQPAHAQSAHAQSEDDHVTPAPVDIAGKEPCA